MKFFKYGIILERLKEEDIEQVRQWRNSDPVRLNMKQREIITQEQQRKWYSSINNEYNNYFLIHYKGTRIGLLNDKNIDWEARTSESGIFLGIPEYYSTIVPYLVSVAGIESTFYLMSWNRQYARILRDNTNAIRFNLELGYVLCKGEEASEHQKFELTRKGFEAKAKKIRKAVRSVSGNDTRAHVLLEPSDYKIGIGSRFEALLNISPFPLEREVTPEGTWYREKEPLEIK